MKKAFLYKKELSAPEIRDLRNNANIDSYYQLNKGEKGIWYATWTVDEEWARILNWIPCTKADIARYKSIYEPKELGELDKVSIKSANKAWFAKVKKESKILQE